MPNVSGSRAKRKNITGAPGWEISESGLLYYQRHLREPECSEDEDLIVDLGPKNTSPVLPAYGDGSQERFVDELVLWEFAGAVPITLQRVTRVRHLDGDLKNCAFENLRREYDEEWEQENHLLNIASLMKSSIPASGLTATASGAKIKGKGTFPYAPLRGEKLPRLSDCPPWSPVDPVWVRRRRNTITKILEEDAS